MHLVASLLVLFGGFIAFLICGSSFVVAFSLVSVWSLRVIVSVIIVCVWFVFFIGALVAEMIGATVCGIAARSNLHDR